MDDFDFFEDDDQDEIEDLDFPVDPYDDMLIEEPEWIDDSDDNCVLDQEFIDSHLNVVPCELLHNFPFVEDDVDAITDYELFSKGFGYLDENKVNKDELSDVAYTGDFNDLINKPDYPDVSEYVKKDTTELENYPLTSSLSSVAFSGDYDDLSDKPTIPSVGNSKLWYGTSSTAAATQTKVVTCSGFTLETGTSIVVTFTNAQTYNGQPKLNVNDTGAIPIQYKSGTNGIRYMWNAGSTIQFIYDGTNFVCEGRDLANTTYYGVTKLNNTVTSTSTTLAATANSVKTTYDYAATKQDAITSTNKLDYSLIDNTPSIPDSTSDLTNDSGYITKNVNDLTNYTLTSNLSTVATSGNYNDLSNKPTIPTVPTNVSAFTNDSGYITKNVNDLTNYTDTSTLTTLLSNKEDVIEIGSNTNGYYKKYSNGLLEVWGSKNIGNIAITTTAGSWYRSDVILGLTYPYEFIATPEFREIIPQSASGLFSIFQTNVSSTTDTGSYYAYRYSSATVTNAVIGFHAIGRWK